MQMWLISDWHWHQQSIYKFTFTDKDGVERRVRERFANAQEGDAYIAQRWAELVKPQDHIWNLGDCTMFEGKHMAHDFIKLMKSLPGHKRLVLGNHDRYHPSVYVDAGFQKVRGSTLIDRVLCSHFPIHPMSVKGNVVVNVHGHIHQNQSPSPQVHEGKVSIWKNVSVEAINYEPIAWEIVKAEIEVIRNKALEEVK